MKKTSIYLLAALAATTFITQARAEPYINPGVIADMTDQQCRQYVKERYLEDAKKGTDESEKIKQDLAKLKRARAAIKKLKKSTDAIAEEFRKAETEAEKKAFWVAFVGWSEFSGTILGLAVAHVTGVSFGGVATTASGLAIGMIDDLKASYDEVGRIGGELGKKLAIANRQLKRTYEAIDLINDWGVKARDQLKKDIQAYKRANLPDRDGADAAVRRYCGESQQVRTYSADEMGLTSNYARATPMFNQAPTSSSDYKLEAPYYINPKCTYLPAEEIARRTDCKDYIGNGQVNKFSRNANSTRQYARPKKQRYNSGGRGHNCSVNGIPCGVP